MTKDVEDPKTYTISGVRSTKDMDRGINDLASKFVIMSTVINELRSIIVGDGNPSNHESNHHGNSRFFPNHDGFFDNHNRDQSLIQI